MDGVLESVLWASLILVAYTFCGYPLLLAVWSWLKPHALITRAPITPAVSIVIAAWNEAPRLVARINNCLEQRYPSDHLEIIIVSDGSTDDTFSVVSAFDHRRVRLVQLEKREGKAAALNAGVSTAEGEIIVFADARQRFAPDVVARLVSHFSDPAVGTVTGELVLESEKGLPDGKGMGLYWTIEKAIRSMESAIDSVVGATGAIYAIRKELYRPLKSGTILDDLVVPMTIAMQGFRVVFDRQAIAVDQLAGDYRQEFRRKVRTLAGNYQAFRWYPNWLSPKQNRLFIQVVSHKVCRLAAPFALLLLFSTSLALVSSGYVYLFVLQVLGYTIALVGWMLMCIGVRERVTAAAFSFCLLNYAALVGAVLFFRGRLYLSEVRDLNLWRKAA
jgi:cellulose synthase/poly-beta-1,6-N-acetylglucosamine synthase-like glycosyltransferase